MTTKTKFRLLISALIFFILYSAGVGIWLWKEYRVTLHQSAPPKVLDDSFLIFLSTESKRPVKVHGYDIKITYPVEMGVPEELPATVDPAFRPDVGNQWIWTRIAWPPVVPNKVSTLPIRVRHNFYKTAIVDLRIKYGDEMESRELKINNIHVNTTW
jgi:hypothetical protein